MSAGRPITSRKSLRFPMQHAMTPVLVIASLGIAGCSVLIDAKLDGRSDTTSGGAGGQGGGAASTSDATTTGSSSASASSAAQSASASTGSGCGSPCKLDHAMPECIDGACVIKACEAPFDDCDHKPENGCEANLNASGEDCGACDNACAGGLMCVGGKCK